MALKEKGDIQSSYNFFLEQNFDKNCLILEIGCNFGSFINLINEAEYPLTIGLDISKKNIQHGRERYQKLAGCFVVGDGSCLPFKTHSIDMITSFDTLEHISDVESHISEIYRVLRDNSGIYVLQTPNRYINIPWEIFHTKDLKGWKRYHCSLQTYSSLKSILANNGFNHVQFFKQNALSEYNCKKVAKQLGKVGLIILKILNFMPIQFASNLWVIARK